MMSVETQRYKARYGSAWSRHAAQRLWYVPDHLSALDILAWWSCHRYITHIVVPSRSMIAWVQQRTAILQAMDDVAFGLPLTNETRNVCDGSISDFSDDLTSNTHFWQPQGQAGARLEHSHTRDQHVPVFWACDAPWLGWPDVGLPSSWGVNTAALSWWLRKNGPQLTPAQATGLANILGRVCQSWNGEHADAPNVIQALTADLGQGSWMSSGFGQDTTIDVLTAWAAAWPNQQQQWQLTGHAGAVQAGLRHWLAHWRHHKVGQGAGVVALASWDYARLYPDMQAVWHQIWRTGGTVLMTTKDAHKMNAQWPVYEGKSADISMQNHRPQDLLNDVPWADGCVLPQELWPPDDFRRASSVHMLTVCPAGTEGFDDWGQKKGIMQTVLPKAHNCVLSLRPVMCAGGLPQQTQVAACLVWRALGLHKNKMGPITDDQTLMPRVHQLDALDVAGDVTVPQEASDQTTRPKKDPYVALVVPSGAVLHEINRHLIPWGVTAESWQTPAIMHVFLAVLHAHQQGWDRQALCHLGGQQALGMRYPVAARMAAILSRSQDGSGDVWPKWMPKVWAWLRPVRQALHGVAGCASVHIGPGEQYGLSGQAARAEENIPHSQAQGHKLPDLSLVQALRAHVQAVSYLVPAVSWPSCVHHALAQEDLNLSRWQACLGPEKARSDKDAEEDGDYATWFQSFALSVHERQPGYERIVVCHARDLPVVNPDQAIVVQGSDHRGDVLPWLSHQGQKSLGAVQNATSIQALQDLGWAPMHAPLWVVQGPSTGFAGGAGVVAGIDEAGSYTLNDIHDTEVQQWLRDYDQACQNAWQNKTPTWCGREESGQNMPTKKTEYPLLKSVHVRDVALWRQNPQKFVWQVLCGVRDDMPAQAVWGAALHRVMHHFAQALPAHTGRLKDVPSVDVMHRLLMQLMDTHHTSLTQASGWLDRHAAHHLAYSIAVCEYQRRCSLPAFITYTQVKGYVSWRWPHLTIPVAYDHNMAQEVTLGLKARLDRVDCMADGSVHIIDYTTASPPAFVALDRYEAITMPLWALLMQAGGCIDGDGSVHEKSSENQDSIRQLLSEWHTNGLDQRHSAGPRVAALTWWHLGLSDGCQARTYPRCVQALLKNYGACVPGWMQALAAGRYDDGPMV